MDEPDLAIRTTTCRTPGCENEGVPLTWVCVPFVICGACGLQITDITEVTND